MLLSPFLAPADTTNYMYLGFAFIYIPMAIYVWSLISRRRKLEKEVTVLEELDE